MFLENSYYIKYLLCYSPFLCKIQARVQGGRLKAKNEIRIASLFKEVPLAFLKMITVHELAHLKEKEHNKAFYKLCLMMEPDYHQIEFDLRLYLTHLDLFGKLDWNKSD
jgi:hypothetical protein